jgi:hypothetical protein
VRNGPLLTLRELLLVRGVTPTVLARLEGFVTVLPPSSLKVNINTAPAEVLYALSDGMLADPGVVDRLIATVIRPRSPRQRGAHNVTGLEQALGERQGASSTPTARTFRSRRRRGRRGPARHRRGREARRRSVKRVTWTPTSANLALTSLPPSDFLATLPVFGDR